MSDIKPIYEDLTQALRDAGCSKAATAQFLQMQERGDEAGQLTLLRTQRESLTDAIRSAQKKLDCLDYLLYQFH